MITSLFPSIIIISFFVLFFGMKCLKNSISKLYYFYWIIFGVYISGLIGITLFPFPYQDYLIQTMIEDNLGSTHNFIPLGEIREIIEFGYMPIVLKQLVGNILLFVPLGFSLPILFTKLNLKSTILICFLVSLTIECIQLVSSIFIRYNYRAFDVDDLLLNVLGSIIGFFVFKLAFKFLNNNELIKSS
ncbi:VanZ family protein [Amphibacillus cookii]|uniref:VanZ family protein n=1 Tax=Amphibacillus cookii TaxID=767787 RepID=UPI001956606A|nr:VanZ family protein [Amphibacillus cookii]MBM7541871.1 glycopeptide antibiotics resistance protein [Amphibacillus cookii]